MSFVLCVLNSTHLIISLPQSNEKHKHIEIICRTKQQKAIDRLVLLEIYNIALKKTHELFTITLPIHNHTCPSFLECKIIISF